jgi:uncharacterized protein
VLYLDTSVLVAALTREAGTAALQTWLSRQDPAELAVSDWVVTEFSGALSQKVRTGHLTPDQRTEVLAVFTQLVDNSFLLWPVSRVDFRTAARFADQHVTALRSGDALHLAIAMNHGGHLRTLDRVQAEAANTLGVSAALL